MFNLITDSKYCGRELLKGITIFFIQDGFPQNLEITQTYSNLYLTFIKAVYYIIIICLEQSIALSY